ncbi:mechanosensitive ion channel family protein [Endozoicomonas sp. SM1973]|uniref:Small-conductance mechanosensitive channel n=1 Tax=Spartinivicinus marinus TaxID=2994442 RepID=A0A853I7E9_9GAMM|nr:mechanosensitive ion channel domain-containing protein [Spartinivicinus marinus]MCX4029251.1 mechanosensitive ion channel [Spartinivicinus marinus]NYZ65841.1 mechanosensitive ion channel family protein [Spartinivicinus marinus]
MDSSPWLSNFFITPEFLTQVSQSITRFIAALLLLLFGFFVARFLKDFSSRLIDSTHRLLHRFSKQGAGYIQQLQPASSRFVPLLVYWVTLIVFIGLATNVLGIEIFTKWIDAFLAYLPTLVAGIVIILGGFIFGEMAKDLATSAAIAANLRHSELLGRIAQVFLAGSAILIGAGQVGIDVTFVVNMATVALAAVLGAFALGFGLATPRHVSNFISARYVQRHYHEGETIQVGDYGGRIVEITPHAVVIETDQGELHIPAKFFTEEPCLKRIKEVQSSKDESEEAVNGE